MATAASKERRTARHAAQKVARKAVVKQLSRRALKALGLTAPPSIPRLTWVRGKTYKQGNGGRKGRSGHLSEHMESFIENGSRTFAKEVDKVLNPVVVSESAVQEP